MKFNADLDNNQSDINTTTPKTKLTTPKALPTSIVNRTVIRTRLILNHKAPVNRRKRVWIRSYRQNIRSRNSLKGRQFIDTSCLNKSY